MRQQAIHVCGDFADFIAGFDLDTGFEVALNGAMDRTLDTAGCRNNRLGQAPQQKHRYQRKHNHGTDHHRQRQQGVSTEILNRHGDGDGAEHSAVQNLVALQAVRAAAAGGYKRDSAAKSRVDLLVEQLKLGLAIAENSTFKRIGRLLTQQTFTKLALKLRAADYAHRFKSRHFHQAHQQAFALVDDAVDHRLRECDADDFSRRTDVFFCRRDRILAKGEQANRHDSSDQTDSKNGKKSGYLGLEVHLDSISMGAICVIFSTLGNCALAARLLWRRAIKSSVSAI